MSLVALVLLNFNYFYKDKEKWSFIKTVQFSLRTFLLFTLVVLLPLVLLNQLGIAGSAFGALVGVIGLVIFCVNVFAKKK
jgi:hypothetical protein